MLVVSIGLAARDVSAPLILNIWLFTSCRLTTKIFGENSTRAELIDLSNHIPHKP